MAVPKAGGAEAKLFEEKGTVIGGRAGHRQLRYDPNYSFLIPHL